MATATQTATTTQTPLLTTSVASTTGDKVIVEFDADVTFTTGDVLTFQVQIDGVTVTTGTLMLPTVGATITTNEAITFESAALTGTSHTITVTWADTAGGGVTTINPSAGGHASLLVEDVSV